MGGTGLGHSLGARHGRTRGPPGVRPPRAERARSPAPMMTRAGPLRRTTGRAASPCGWTASKGPAPPCSGPAWQVRGAGADRTAPLPLARFAPGRRPGLSTPELGGDGGHVPTLVARRVELHFRRTAAAVGAGDGGGPVG